MTADEIGQLLGSLGQHFSADELKEMVEAGDFDGDHQISFPGQCSASVIETHMHVIVIHMLSCSILPVRCTLLLYTLTPKCDTIDGNFTQRPMYIIFY